MFRHAVQFLNNIKIRNKLWGMYLFCVIIPLIVTDGAVLAGLFVNGGREQENEMYNVAYAVDNIIESQISRAEYIRQNIYLNSTFDNYLDQYYSSNIDYYNAYTKIMNNTFFIGNTTGADRTNIILYADNSSITNGGRFQRLETALDQPWYQAYEEYGERNRMMFYYDDFNAPLYAPKRKVLLISKMDHFSNRIKKIMKIELDYNTFSDPFRDMNFGYPVYFCKDGQVLITNDGYNNIGQAFESFDKMNRVGVTHEITLYGEKYQIYVLRKPNYLAQTLLKMLPMIAVMLAINFALPMILMFLINKSFTERLRALEKNFNTVDTDHLEPIRSLESKDEIGELVNHYNDMAVRMNGLIQRVYKDQIHEKDINLAKQKAELLALYSQINPHFLFNALESIRMHSVLKGEDETADMIQNLAVMQRQYVDWGNDIVEIHQEMEFVEAYLELQKYRFGDRLSYELSVDKDCKKIKIPKLTIVTFVENACVHGIESKSAPGWVFVRISRRRDSLILEVEDTGGGMEDNKVKEILDSMNHASIESIQQKKSVGIQNACLRLKMLTGDRTKFSIESELGIGTITQVVIPLEENTLG